MRENLPMYITIVTIIVVWLFVWFPSKPPQPTPVFEFQNHKELPDGQHRYDIYHQGIRSGYVVLPGSICGVENVVVAVHD